MAQRPPLPLAPLGALLAALVVGLGLGLEAAGHQLGTATPPFVMSFGVRVDPLAAVSVLAAALAALLVPRLPALVRTPRAYAAALFAVMVGLALALNLGRYGVDGWTRVFDLGPGGSFEAKNEYLPGLPALSYGTGFLLDRFAELVPALPVNVAGHPPGLMLVIHALGIDTAGQLAALCIGLGALTAPLAYATGRALLDEDRARVAGLLCALSPALLLVGASSADFVYAAAGAACAWLLVTRPALGAVALALASLLSWALLAIGAWAVLVAVQRDGWRRAIALAAGCAAAVVALDAALYAGWGYDAIGTLRATHEVYRHSLAEIRPYWFWVLGSPVAWAVMAGLPIAGWALTAAARREPVALATVAVVAIAAVLGFTKAETERIWLFLVPLAALSAAASLPRERVGLAVRVLLVQALVTELLFDTIW
jgi:hypothetical protein